MKTLRFFLIPLVFSLNCGLGIAQTPEIGQVAPEVVLTSPDGQELKLSDHRGKMVLVDFWASWCAPCRRKNPDLVKAYHNFKDTEFLNGDGFVVFSISLDSRRERWLEAIDNDKLEWPHHVSDLRGWRSEIAREYGVKAIPANFLIDGDGVIVAVNLRGDDIESTLGKYRKTWLRGVFRQ